MIIDSLRLNLVPGSRIGLLGRNGAGKSTLIKLLAGEKEPMSGEYETSAGLRIGYFAQHQLEFLRPQDTAIDHLFRLDKKATEQQLRDYLGGFGFHGEEAHGKVAPMSGGEKARLVLALIVYQKPNLLLLDEPTNHLDLEMRHALNLALQGFDGAMVLVSHDRFLLSSVCDDFYLVDCGKVEPFAGDLDDYRDWILKDKSAKSAESTADADQNDPKNDKLDRKTIKRLEAQFRQATQGLRKTIEKQEQQMAKISKMLGDIELKLADPTLYADDNKAKLKSMLLDQAQAKNALEEAEMEWFDAQEKLEVEQQSFEQQHVAS